MWKKGTSPRNVFTYLGAFCTLKPPMLGFEIGFANLRKLGSPLAINLAWMQDDAVAGGDPCEFDAKSPVE